MNQTISLNKGGWSQIHSLIILCGLLASAPKLLLAQSGKLFEPGDSPASATPQQSPSSTNPPAPAPPPAPGQQAPASTQPAPTTAPAQATALLSVPSASQRQIALKLIREVYGGQISKARLAADKMQLAKRLIQAGIDEKQDMAGRYVLLNLAMENAIAAADLDTSFKAIDELAGTFSVDPLTLKADAAASVSKSLRLPQDRKEFVSKLDPLVLAAVASERFDVAKQLSDLCVAAARGTEVVLAREMNARAQQVREVHLAFEEAKAAGEILKRNPRDGEAALKVGKYRCFIRRDWKEGLPLLARSSASSLQKLAQQDLNGATSPQQQVELGDVWWQEAEKLTGRGKLAAQQRGSYWYSQALATLDKGLLRQKLEHRLQLVPAEIDAPSVRAEIGAPAGAIHWSVENLQAFEQLKVLPTWSRLHVKTTLAAQRVEGALVLSRQDSPYLVTGMVLITKNGSLTIEPGTVVLFGPQVKLQVDGACTAVSEGPWIVLASADPKARWGGLECRQKMQLRRCLVDGAIIAASQPQGSATVEQCIFANSGTALDIGNNGRGTAKHCLFLRNELGVTGHGDAGHVQFSNCLLLFSKRGCTANFYGRCEATNCTFYGNETAIEAADRGTGVRVNLSNVISTAGQPLSTRGGKAMAVGNYWGKNGPPLDGSHDCSGALAEFVKDATPDLPACEYLLNR